MIPETKKQSVLSQLRQVTETNDFSTLNQLYQEIVVLSKVVLFTELETWLLTVLQEEELYIIHVILARLYRESSDWDNALRHMAMASIHLPDLSNWDDDIKDTFIDEFEEFYSSSKRK